MMTNPELRATNRSPYLEPALPHNSASLTPSRCPLGMDNRIQDQLSNGRSQISSFDAIRHHHMAASGGMVNHRELYRHLDAKKHFPQRSASDSDASRLQGADCGSPTLSPRSLLQRFESQRRDSGADTRQCLDEDRLHGQGIKRSLSEEDNYTERNMVIT